MKQMRADVDEFLDENGDEEEGEAEESDAEEEDAANDANVACWAGPLGSPTSRSAIGDDFDFSRALVCANFYDPEDTAKEENV